MRHYLLWAQQVDNGCNEINKPTVFYMYTLCDKENTAATYKIKRLNSKNRHDKQEAN